MMYEQAFHFFIPEFNQDLFIVKSSVLFVGYSATYNNMLYRNSVKNLCVTVIGIILLYQSIHNMVINIHVCNYYALAII